MLRDASGFLGGHVGFANGVKQRGFAVVDMSHHSYDRSPLAQVLRPISLLDFMDHLLLVSDHGGFGAKSARHFGGGGRVEGLVDGGKDALVEEFLDHVPGARLQLLRQFLDADALADRDLARDGNFDRRGVPRRRSGNPRNGWARRRNASGGSGSSRDGHGPRRGGMLWTRLPSAWPHGRNSLGSHHTGVDGLAGSGRFDGSRRPSWLCGSSVRRFGRFGRGHPGCCAGPLVRDFPRSHSASRRGRRYSRADTSGEWTTRRRRGSGPRRSHLPWRGGGHVGSFRRPD